MNDREGLPRRIAEVARSLQSETGSADTMDLAVKLAVEAVDGSEDAAITLVQRGRMVETPAATSDRAREVDRIQHELGVGPCMTAAWETDVIVCPDLANETRWGQWGPKTAQETGIASMLCFRMFTHREQIGALSVYASRPNAFATLDVDSGISFAAHTAIAIAVARQDENKDIALDSRTLIGQATGIIMCHYDVDALRAFAVLRRLSQETNLKLHEVAAELVRTRQLPK